MTIGSRRTARRVLAMLAAAASLALVGEHASAQAWPARTIRLVVPAAPGGSADPIARLVAEELGRALRQSVVVENRPGANGNIGAAAVAKAPADGYTLLLGWTGTLISAVTLYDAKPFHPLKDFEPIALVGAIPNVIIAHPSIPSSSLAELTDYARRHPGKLNFGSTGSGSSYHLSGELYKKTMGVYMVHVPYTSPGAVLTDLIGNRLQLAFPGITAAAPFVREGTLRAVAVMAPARSEVLPGTPTTTELGFPALVSETWFGVLAPRGTPAEVVARINEAINAAVAAPAFRGRLVSMGFTPLGGTTERFTMTMKDDIVRWGEVVKFSGAKVD